MPREWLRNSVLPLQPLEPESEIWGVGGRIYREPPPAPVSSQLFSGKWLPLGPGDQASPPGRVLQEGPRGPQPWL